MRTLTCLWFCLVVAPGWWLPREAATAAPRAPRPNILVALSDDQSYPHASAYGCSFVRTPAFDRVARDGVLFTNAFAASPGCSPSRASLLTGRYPWQNEQAGTHASSFASTYLTYPQLLAAAGYKMGHTGKGWGPGNFAVGGFSQNPAGPAYSVATKDVPDGIHQVDYAGSFRQFLTEWQANGDPPEPFCFWFGAHEPHRRFHPEIGQQHGAAKSDVQVPGFLPDLPAVRSDLLDYAFEIEWYDRHLQQMLDELAARGQLENTIVIVTSDNGMAFPRAKANCYEFGIHMPLAIRWGAQVPGGRTVTDLVSLVDLMPTILDAAGVTHPGEPAMAGHSLVPLLKSGRGGRVDPGRDAVYAARERHSSSRWNNLGYPQRAIRSDGFLYIRNFHPERWPAGAPQTLVEQGSSSSAPQLGPPHGAYHDVDASPTLELLVDGRHDPGIASFFHLATAHRPAEELYDVQADPACLHNLSRDSQFAEQRRRLAGQLEKFLQETGDPRAESAVGLAGSKGPTDRERGTGSAPGVDIFETYRRYSPLRSFPTPAWAAAASARPDEPTRPLASRWAYEMQSFASQDIAGRSGKHEVVFVGSSTIRLWDVGRWFPETPILNRGFGGSVTADTNACFDLLVAQHQPRLVVLYAGDNDLAQGMSPAQVTNDFREFVSLLHEALPRTRLGYLAIKPSISRWALIDTIRETNLAIRRLCESDPLCEFVDVEPPMIGPDGKPRPELFAADGLHLNETGYALWTELVKKLVPTTR